MVCNVPEWVLLDRDVFAGAMRCSPDLVSSSADNPRRNLVHNAETHGVSIHQLLSTLLKSPCLQGKGNVLLELSREHGELCCTLINTPGLHHTTSLELQAKVC